MKRAIAAAAAALALAAQARVMPISEGRLYTDLDAAGHSITNLPDGFFPTNGFLRAETDPTVPAWAKAPEPPAMSLEPSTNYTDRALGTFASTGAVARASTYGTPTRWTDATGCVLEVVSGWLVYTNSVVAHGWLAYQYATDSGPFGNTYELRIRPAEGTDDEGYAVAAHTFPDGVQPSWSNEYEKAFNSDAEFYGLSYGDEIRILRGATNIVGRVALTNDIPDVSGYATQQQATNAAVAVADAKISTNNAAFVSAVLAVPIAGADATDLAEIAGYGGYGTVGAALLALIAGLAALKRRMVTAETAVSENATAVASVRADLPYALVEPGEWEFSGLPSGATNITFVWASSRMAWLLEFTIGGSVYTMEGAGIGGDSALNVTCEDENYTVTATRPSLPGHLCDRAGNRVVVSGDTTLTLPAAVPGHIRDFLVRLEISGSTVPTITFAAPTGETITYEMDGDTFPVPDEAGTWSYSFTENCVAHKFAVSLKKVNEVAAPQAQGGS